MTSQVRIATLRQARLPDGRPCIRAKVGGVELSVYRDASGDGWGLYLALPSAPHSARRSVPVGKRGRVSARPKRQAPATAEPFHDDPLDDILPLPEARA
jgi:hypothetical protein